MARKYAFIDEWDLGAPMEAVTLDRSSEIVRTGRQ
jgi:hypothetical protein